MEVGIFEAKTHFSDLVERAGRGEEITVTKRGKPVARIVPIEEPAKSVQEVVDEIRASRVNLGPDIDLRAMIAEGRL